MTTLSSVKCAAAGIDCIELEFRTPDPAGASNRTIKQISLKDAEELSSELLETVRKVRQLARDKKIETLTKLTKELRILEDRIEKLTEEINHGE